MGSVSKLQFPLPAALLLALPLFGQGHPLSSANAVADEVWAGFQRALWDTSIREWVGVESIGGGLNCQEFHGYSYESRADDEWCYRCTTQSEIHTAEWFFYAFSLEEPLACRLERFHASVTGPPKTALEKIHSDLAVRLDGLYGSGQDPGRASAEFGSANWRAARRWQTRDLQAYLYIKELRGQPPALGLFARHRHLLDAIAAESKRPYRFKWGRWLERWGTLLDQKLADELRADFPILPTLLLKEPAYPPKPSTQEEVRTTLMCLLKTAELSSPDRRSALLLAADRLADRAHADETFSSGSGQIRERIAGYELGYIWNYLGNNWAYTHDLLWRVWQDYGGTEWGELAFILLLNLGWNTSVDCSKGSDLFREVIRRGEEFLTEHPKSSYRLDVFFVLAQAYETGWSASQASIQDSYVDRHQYQEGASAARDKAISYYEKVLQLAPAGYEADYARLRLPRLKLGLDTNQRRFFCIYD